MIGKLVRFYKGGLTWAEAMDMNVAQIFKLSEIASLIHQEEKEELKKNV